MADSRKGSCMYGGALNVRNSIGSVMASIKEHGTQYDAMGSQKTLRYKGFKQKYSHHYNKYE